MITKPKRSSMAVAAAFAAMTGLAAAPALAQTNAGNNGNTAGTTNGAPAGTTNGAAGAANGGGVTQSGGGSGLWGLVGLIGLAGLAPMFRGNRTVATPTGTVTGSTTGNRKV